MSQMVATVKSIENLEQLNIVEFEFQGQVLKMMSLDLNTNIRVGKKVVLSVKPTNIALAKQLVGEISFSNQMVATIQTLTHGKLLSSIGLTINGIVFESIITLSSAKRMNLHINDEVVMLIKASDLFILDVFND
ncbi:MAG: transporter [Deltaproteobacteria bacterium HGW-Deltaproteobacteria-24]|jgi:molybdopterin-binding protein|nr:MAG: transporter [Deltaproteobacteria bacterium HGW-Deltaproteobacteria-24]